MKHKPEPMVSLLHELDYPLPPQVAKIISPNPSPSLHNDQLIMPYIHWWEKGGEAVNTVKVNIPCDETQQLGLSPGHRSCHVQIGDHLGSPNQSPPG